MLGGEDPSMSDCVYLAWAEAATDLGVEPQEGSRPLFDLARSLIGHPRAHAILFG